MKSPVVQGFDPTRFCVESWQRQPSLFRDAFPAFTCPIDGNDLADLACLEEAQARLILGPDEQSQWQVEYGPIDPDRFRTLPQEDWTLLVQDVDKWNPAVRRILDAFRFLPDWRIDDIMVSFAVDGGSVGAHWDHYDVFLLQGVGQRRWSIDASDAPDLSPRTDSDLKLLEHFAPTHSWVLNPGDMLYLPPGVPHHGVAVGACLTLSIGLRAPSAAELLLDFAADRAEALDESVRLHPGLGQTPSSAPIDPATIAAARALVRDALDCDDATFGRWLGGFLTRYRLPERPDQDGEMPPPAGELQRCPWSRFSWSQTNGETLLFVNGQAMPCTRDLAHALSSGDPLSLDDLPNDPASRKLIDQLIADGMLRPPN